MILNLLSGIAAKLSAAGIAAKAGAGIAIATASVTGVAAVGVLPGTTPPVKERVEVTTTDASVQEDTPEDTGAPVEPSADSGFGATVSADASNPESPGVDGALISEAARKLGAQHRPAEAGAPADAGAQGMTRASETPAAGRLPEQIPGGPATADQYRPEAPVAGQPDETPAGAPEDVPSGAPADTSGDAPEDVPAGSAETVPAGPPAGVPGGRG